MRNRQHAAAQLYAFDLLELDGRDLRGEPIEKRKAALDRLLGKDRAGLLMSQPIDHRQMSPSNMCASLAWKASSQRSWAPNTSLGVLQFGSKQSIRMPQHCTG